MTGQPFNPDLIKPPAEEGLFGEGPISVSELTAMVKRALTRLPPRLAVAGELSNFSRAPSGHLYFTLKDPAACVDCVMWRSDAGRLKFAPADGLAVIAFGQIDVYEPRGRYQLYVSRLLPAGRGELELAFRQLCEKLEKLGWFAAARKRAIPRIPRTVGLVTSRVGAAIRDVLRTLALRWPLARVVVADVRVQGEGSADAVAAAIGLMNRQASAVGGVDVLIVARGGGSLEDLWGFNTETVARAILDSKIPVVTGIGHEIDTTIADLVADLRAATPTAAAQAVAPDRQQIGEQLGVAHGRLFRGVRERLRELSGRLAGCARVEPFRRPAALLRGPRQVLDELSARLGGRQRELLHRRMRRLAELAGRLDAQHPRAVLGRRWRAVEILAGRLRWAQGRANVAAERRLTALGYRLRACGPAVRLPEADRAVERSAADLRSAGRRCLAGRAQALDARGRQLAAFNPRAVLRRGYSMTTLKVAGKLLTRAGQARPGDRLVTELAEGRLESEVTGDGPAAGPPRRRKPPADAAEQMNLEF